MPMFLDGEQPLHTCKEKDCRDCDVGSRVNCHFRFRQLFIFFAFAVPIFLIGGIGIYRFSLWTLILWILLALSYFGLIEIRVMCSHCPHYAEPGSRSLKCWANYGSPKLWRYRPGPMSGAEKTVFFAGLYLVFLLPVLLMLLSGSWLLLILYLVVTAVGAWMLRNRYCVKCMNFACPLNRVEEDTRARFISHNPVIFDAWRDSQK